jgi:hypothetical protein
LYLAIRNLANTDRDSAVSILAQNGAPFSKLPLFTKFTGGYNLRIRCAKIFGDNISNKFFGVENMHAAPVGSHQPTRAESTAGPEAGIQPHRKHPETPEKRSGKMPA